MFTDEHGAIAERCQPAIAFLISVATLLQMRFDRANRALTSWIAVLAILVMSLAPTVSHALAGAGTPFQSEVCSADGSSKFVALSRGAPKAPATDDGVAAAHCPYCVLHAHAAFLPSVPPAFVSPGLAASTGRASGAMALHPRPVWTSASPRGPPRFS
jgi:hypothetical protein